MLPIFKSLIEGSQASLRRFPVAIILSFAIMVLLFLMVNTPWDAQETALNDVVNALAAVIPAWWMASVAASLWSHSRGGRLNVVLQSLIAVVAVVDTVALYAYSSTYDGEAFAIGQGVATAMMAVIFYIPVTVKGWRGNSRRLLDYAFRLVGWSISIYLLMLFVGMALMSLGGVVEMLFAFNCMGTMLALTVGFCVGMGALLLLTRVPSVDVAVEYPPMKVSRFVRFCHFYLLTPIAALYLVVLYCYGLKILATWTLPEGMVSYPVAAFMSIWLLLRLAPAVNRDDTPRFVAGLYSRWLPVLSFPLLVLMTVGLGRRVADYGITVDRLYGLTLNAWFYLATVWLLIPRLRRFQAWLPFTAAGVAVIVSVLPVNYSSIVEGVLRSRVEGLLESQGFTQLPVASDKLIDDDDSSPGRRQLISDVNYLRFHCGRRSLGGLVEYKSQYEYEDYLIPGLEVAVDTVVVEQISRDGRCNVWRELPKGYGSFTNVYANYGDGALVAAKGDTAIVARIIADTDTANLEIPVARIRDAADADRDLRVVTPDSSALYIFFRYTLDYSDGAPEDFSFNGYQFSRRANK